MLEMCSDEVEHFVEDCHLLSLLAINQLNY